MPRKRTIPDHELLGAALDIVHSSGPAALSFGTLSQRVGLAGSTLVQRFGTRASLLQQTLLLAWDRLDDDTARAVAAAPSGPDGVIDLLVGLSGQYTVDDFADQLLVLREDLRDPVLRARGDAWITSLSAAIDERLEPGAGRLVVAQWQGTLTVWSFTRPASLPDTVRDAITELVSRLTPAPPTRPRLKDDAVLKDSRRQ